MPPIEDSLDWVPAYDSDAARLQFRSFIAAKPTQARFRGSSVTVRTGEPSHRRRAELAAMRDELVDLEVYIALAQGETPPQKADAPDDLEIDGYAWRVVEAQDHPGRGCYVLSVSRMNP